MLRHIRTVGLAATLVLILAAPASAGPIEECYDAVLGKCSAAMEGAGMLERFSLGLMCTGLLVGCVAAAF